MPGRTRIDVSINQHTSSPVWICRSHLEGSKNSMVLSVYL
ncbi:hypothetical protein GLUCOINTEAF2_0203726 [Komagataeibacter intermedius AF2]|uniref:Uncharacterized protein n=1 Tax=Komagataeibacter intermedius AF2 TaxID=1458464 RepID=A0A0N0MGE0_9PROT|nr:hypothetical protein GLUCOINTEAF2_0203726 [Komagataeibacter intermedius AF2]